MLAAADFEPTGWTDILPGDRVPHSRVLMLSHAPTGRRWLAQGTLLSTCGLKATAWSFIR
jgi:hypothetical protein